MTVVYTAPHRMDEPDETVIHQTTGPPHCVKNLPE
jgi:hypothetical protein